MWHLDSPSALSNLCISVAGYLGLMDLGEGQYRLVWRMYIVKAMCSESLGDGWINDYCWGSEWTLFFLAFAVKPRLYRVGFVLDQLRSFGSQSWYSHLKITDNVVIGTRCWSTKTAATKSIALDLGNNVCYWRFVLPGCCQPSTTAVAGLFRCLGQPHFSHEFSNVNELHRLNLPQLHVVWR